MLQFYISLQIAHINENYFLCLKREQKDRTFSSDFSMFKMFLSDKSDLYYSIPILSFF